MGQEKSGPVDSIKQRHDIDFLADEVMHTYAEFNMSLTAKGKFPFDQFKAFYNAVVRYADATKKGNMIHRNVASAVNGLIEDCWLQSEIWRFKTIKAWIVSANVTMQ
jgi:hypothetical protein